MHMGGPTIRPLSPGRACVRARPPRGSHSRPKMWHKTCSSQPCTRSGSLRDRTRAGRAGVVPAHLPEQGHGPLPSEQAARGCVFRGPARCGTRPERDCRDHTRVRIGSAGRWPNSPMSSRTSSCAGSSLTSRSKMSLRPPVQRRRGEVDATPGAGVAAARARQNEGGMTDGIEARLSALACSVADGQPPSAALVMRPNALGTPCSSPWLRGSHQAEAVPDAQTALRAFGGHRNGGDGCRGSRRRGSRMERPARVGAVRHSRHASERPAKLPGTNDAALHLQFAEQSLAEAHDHVNPAQSLADARGRAERGAARASGRPASACGARYHAGRSHARPRTNRTSKATTGRRSRAPAPRASRARTVLDAQLVVRPMTPRAPVRTGAAAALADRMGWRWWRWRRRRLTEAEPGRQPPPGQLRLSPGGRSRRSAPAPPSDTGQPRAPPCADQRRVLQPGRPTPSDNPSRRGPTALRDDLGAIPGPVAEDRIDLQTHSWSSSPAPCAFAGAAEAACGSCRDRPGPAM